MANELKDLDANQVIRSVYDPVKNCLRVCIVDNSGSGPPGGIEVAIHHTEDSIRLGDGIDFITSTVFGAKRAYDVYVVNSSSGFVGDTDAVSMPTAGNEYTYTFPLGTKKFEFRSRRRGRTRFGYSTGNRNFSVMPGETKEISNLATTVPTTIYVESTKNNDTLEVHFWI